MTSSESASFFATSGSVANANRPTNAGSPACNGLGPTAPASQAVAVKAARRHQRHGVRNREPPKGHLVYYRENECKGLQALNYCCSLWSQHGGAHSADPRPARVRITARAQLQAQIRTRRNVASCEEMGGSSMFFPF